ncbi:MAG: hypothetical protein NVS2B4_12540 [Ramlibacter sp.]
MRHRAALDGWKRVTDAVHRRGGRIYTQLWHIGRVSHVDVQPGGRKPVAPSATTARTKTFLIKDGVGSFVDTSEPRALRSEELPRIVHEFRAAARNALTTAGLDGVEVHAANGYLLDQFLKSGSNQRSDDHGGSIENRARLLLEVVRGITQDLGPGRIALRLSPVTPANDADDAAPQPLFEYVVRQLAPLGLAYVHIIEGATGGARELPHRPFDYAARRLAAAGPHAQLGRRAQVRWGRGRIRAAARRRSLGCAWRPIRAAVTTTLAGRRLRQAAAPASASVG